MLTLGTFHILKIVEETPEGLLLEVPDEDNILLPDTYRDASWKVGDQIEVLVYRDGNHNIIATTETPYINLNGYAYLKVKQVNDVGAFCDWGTTKDLLVHDNNQLDSMEEDFRYVVHMYLDEATNRLEGSTLLKDFLQPEADDAIYKGKEVEVLVYDRSRLGYQVVIDQKYDGLIYTSDADHRVRIGHTLRGYVKPLREDGRIDISIKPFGFQNIEPNAKKLLEMLEDNDGHLPFTDKSDPEDIRRKFRMSKKVFKKALGSLYKQKLVLLKPDGIYKV